MYYVELWAEHPTFQIFTRKNVLNKQNAYMYL